MPTKSATSNKSAKAGTTKPTAKTQPGNKSKTVARGTKSAASKKPVAAASTTAAPASISADGKPIWLDVKGAKLAAKKRNKPVIADFYTDWCGWCKTLDKSTFHNPEVEDYLGKNFVCMKVNAEDGADGQQLAQQYQINGYPTVMIFRANGSRIGGIQGYRGPKEFLEEVKAIISPSPAHP